MKRATLILAALALLLGGVGQAKADFVTFIGSGNDGGQGSGTNLSASVTFDLSGTNLTVTLQNTTVNSAGGVYHNADVLTAVYWQSPSTLGATPVSAALGSGSSLIETGGTDRDGPLGGNWQYATGSRTYAGKTINQGIESSGLDIFGDGNFGGTSQHLDGSGWGIISTSDTTAADGALNTSPFVRDTVVFTLKVNPGTTLSDLTNVVFQYGTSSGEPSFSGTPSTSVVPAPPTFILAAAGILGLLPYAWRRRKLAAA